MIAHEIGHHVQNLLGETRQAERLGAHGPTSGSVRLELQADCYAGVWAGRNRNLIEPGDFEEGMTAASAIGGPERPALRRLGITWPAGSRRAVRRRAVLSRPPVAA